MAHSGRPLESPLEVCLCNSTHPGLQQGSKIHSALDQRRSQLQKQAAARALLECLVDYEFRALQVCACNVAHPGLWDGRNRGVKYTQHWNSTAHNCRSKLRFFAIVMSITSFEPCEFAPGMSHNLGVVRLKQQGSIIHSALEQRSSQLQKQFAKMCLLILGAFKYIQHIWRTPSVWKVQNYFNTVVFFVILPWSHQLENVTLYSVSPGVRRTPSTPEVYAAELEQKQLFLNWVRSNTWVRRSRFKGSTKPIWNT